MTYAENLKLQGIKLGKQEWIQLDKQEGIKHAQQEIAKQLLKSGIDSSIIVNATHLTIKQLEEIKKSIN